MLGRPGILRISAFAEATADKLGKCAAKSGLCEAVRGDWRIVPKTIGVHWCVFMVPATRMCADRSKIRGFFSRRIFFLDIPRWRCTVSRRFLSACLRIKMFPTEKTEENGTCRMLRSDALIAAFRLRGIPLISDRRSDVPTAGRISLQRPAPDLPEDRAPYRLKADPLRPGGRVHVIPFLQERNLPS